MKFQYYKEELKKVMSPYRYDHSIRVATLAQELAHLEKVDSLNCYLAGLFHDVAKEQSPSLDYNLFSKEQHQLYDSYPHIWHSFVIVEVCKKIFPALSPDIAKAGLYHSTGCAKMSPIQKIV